MGKLLLSVSRERGRKRENAREWKGMKSRRIALNKSIVLYLLWVNNKRLFISRKLL